MKFFYSELYVGSTASSLVGNYICLGRTVIHKEFLSINGIKIHLQFICVSRSCWNASFTIIFQKLLRSCHLSLS